MLDRLNSQLGKASAWLTLLMVLVSFVIVIMRYVFDAGLIWLQESVVWMHAIGVHGWVPRTRCSSEDHVRVDIFYRDMSPSAACVGGPASVCWFSCLPLCRLPRPSRAGTLSATSWALKEASRESGGLPYPLVPMLKSLDRAADAGHAWPCRACR